MKVCPKCNSSYSDETLNFCLADGVPLVPQEILEEYLSKQNSGSWHTAETLVDTKFTGPEARQTTVNPSVRTLSMTAAETGFHRSRRFILPTLLVLLVCAVGGAWWYSTRTPGVANMISENTPSIPKRAIVPITPEQDAQVRKEITDFLMNWAKTNSDKNADAHLALYANVLDVYYGESGKDKNHVLADRLRAYQRYETIEMRVDNLKITPESTESASVLFDKSWTMRNDKKTSTGSVQQEVHISRTNGRWLIDAEKDVKVYFLNNRENNLPDSAASNEAQPAATNPASNANNR